VVVGDDMSQGFWMEVHSIAMGLIPGSLPRGS
jgi:hypothetical protein